MASSFKNANHKLPFIATPSISIPLLMDGQLFRLHLGIVGKEQPRIKLIVFIEYLMFVETTNECALFRLNNGHKCVSF